MEEASFIVKVEIEPIPVSLSWLNQFLDLDDFSLDKPENSLCSSDFEIQEGRETNRGLNKSQLLDVAKKRKSKPFADRSSRKDDCSFPKLVRFQNCGVGGAPTDVDKGKKQWVCIPRPRTNSRSNRNAKIVIRDNLVQELTGCVGNYSNKNISDGLLQDGPPLLGPSKGTDGILSVQEEGELISYRINSVGQGCVTHKRISGITIDLMGECEAEDHLGQSFLQQTDQGVGSLENRSHSDRSSKSSTSFLQKDAEAVTQPKTPNKRKGGKKCRTSKNHAMKTKNSKVNTGGSEEAVDKDSSENRSWSLEVELAKVIEKGVELGVNFNKSNYEERKQQLTLCPLIASGEWGTNGGDIENRKEREEWVSVGSCDSDSVDGDSMEGDNDLKGVNIDGPAIDLFVDLGGLEPFVRKGKVGNSVDSLCPLIARRSNKNPSLPRSHKMKTRRGARGFDSKASIKSFGKENIASKVKKVSWNLKEELAKVIIAGVDLGYDFKGREKETVKEIVRRIKVGSFGKLEGILPFKNN
ncbi:hypothetical protein LWI29_015607 [Acer saccharum]|uniref:Uncharacterized protein n=1 Tax=Acer saccharum TaxID=4024 RepID=A0AA39T003_ACESA|nr:hypothetical protein LWI29_015607 [Acer saccharum]